MGQFLSRIFLSSLLLGLLIIKPTRSYGQDYVYISSDAVYRLFRVNFGYTQWGIQMKDSINRIARGIHLSNETKVFSRPTKLDQHFTIHDAFYLDLNLGLMATKPRSTQNGIGGPQKEGRFSFTSNFGYLFLAGYRTKRFAALGGIDFRWRIATVGGMKMPNINGPLLYYSLPLVGRLECAPNKSKPNKRLIAMLWATKNTTKRIPYQSLRVEYAITKNGRWNLCSQYIKQVATGENGFLSYTVAKCTFTQFWLGFRIGMLP